MLPLLPLQLPQLIEAGLSAAHAKPLRLRLATGAGASNLWCHIVRLCVSHAERAGGAGLGKYCQQRQRGLGQHCSVSPGKLRPRKMRNVEQAYLLTHQASMPATDTLYYVACLPAWPSPPIPLVTVKVSRTLSLPHPIGISTPLIHLAAAWRSPSPCGDARALVAVGGWPSLRRFQFYLRVVSLYR